MPVGSVDQKNASQPTAWTRKPQIGPETMRGSPKRLENRAYCVAEKRFSELYPDVPADEIG